MGECPVCNSRSEQVTLCYGCGAKHVFYPAGADPAIRQAEQTRDKLAEAARFALEILDADARILTVEEGRDVTRKAAEKLRAALAQADRGEAE